MDSDIDSVNCAIKWLKNRSKVINKPWIKSIHSGQKVTSGYLEIINNGKSDDVLLSIESNFAKNNQIHSMNIQNDVMKMKHLKSGLLIKKKI